MALVGQAGHLEVVFSFDTTGSMYSCLEQVRCQINDMIQRLQADIPGIRTAVFAHGDYCDAGKTYVTKWIDFSTNVVELCDFVSNIERTGGGDAPECYELVLYQTRTKLSWTPGSRRVLVMIGDDVPHDPDYHLNTDNIDWKHETKELAMGGVTIYPVQCGGGHDATAFYKTLAVVTGGTHLRLDNFGNIFDVLMAVCYKEGNDTALLSNYEKEVRARCGSVAIGSDIEAVFASLRGENGSAPSPVSSTDSTVTKSPIDFKKKFPSVKRLKTKAPLSSPVGKRKSSTKTVVPKKVVLYRLGNLPHLKRENVPETNFSLRCLSWSDWTMVLSPDMPTVNPGFWEKRNGMLGYRRKYIVSSEPFNRKILYELSVRTPGSGRQRHVVHCGFSSRCLFNGGWESCLLRKKRSMVDRLLSSGCSVFLRFHQMSPDADVSALRRCVGRYDYAWKSIRKNRNVPRSAKKGEHYISFRRQGCVL